MRSKIILFLALISPHFAIANMVKDTLYTSQNDRIILTYDVSVSGEDLTIKFPSKPRIIPSDELRKACGGDLENLKVVLFDRIGDFGKTKWKGLSPTAFTVPAGISYSKTDDGYYILGQSAPLSFVVNDDSKVSIKFPLYIAVYEKKQTYRVVNSSSEPLTVKASKESSLAKTNTRVKTETEQIAIHSSEELEADNEDITRALTSMQLIRQLLDTETELPFSQTLQMEISNLRFLKDRIKDNDVIVRINNLFIEYNTKERELKESQRSASLAAQAQEKALLEQQKQEEQQRQQEAEEKARVREEKQQKRTLWMIIGGVILAILAFIGNAVFKHFRDLSNQKSIMQMQESIAKQAEHEAGRRTREIVRNKAHQMANKGKNKLRETITESKDKANKKSKIKSI